MQSQPETELSGIEELNGDTAILEQLARKREGEPAAEVEDEAEVEADEVEAAEEVEDDDPEFDLGEVKAKKSEILAWKAGEMKDADYRRKTAEAAEAKREAQAIREHVEKERMQYANQLDVLIGQLQTELVGDQQYLAQLANENPSEWVRQNAFQQQRFNLLQQAVTERQAIEQREAEAAASKRIEYTKQQFEALQSKLPEWRDTAVRQQELSDVDQFLRQNGWDDGDMQVFLDHRVYLLARKAWQADKREAARIAAKDKQVKPTPHKALKAGAASEDKANVDAYKEAQRRAKSGREEDLMALLAAKRRK